MSEDTSSWNDKIEEAAEQIGNSAGEFKLMHIQEAQRANNTYKVLMFLGIVSGPLAGVMAGIETAINPSVDHPVISISVVILSFLSGIIVAGVKFGKYDEVSNANKTASARYASIESNVRRQLSLYRKDRVKAVSYMEWLESKYEELFMSAPLLSSSGTYKANQPARSETIIIEADGDPDDGNPDDGDPDDGNHTPGQTRKTGTLSQIPTLNNFSDNMLQYEMNRMLSNELR